MVVSWLSTNYTNIFIYCYSQLTTTIIWWYGARTKTQHCWQLAISATKVSGKKALNTKVKIEKGRAQEKKPFDCIMALKSKLNILFLNTSREGEITISLGKTFQYLIILMKKQLLNFWFLINLKLLCIWSEFWCKMYEWDLKLKWSLKFISERPLIIL